MEQYNLYQDKILIGMNLLVLVLLLGLHME